MKSFSPKPLKIKLGSFKFFEIFASQGASPVSTSPVANLPSVYFVTATAGVVDTGGKCVTFGASILNFVLFTVNYA